MANQIDLPSRSMQAGRTPPLSYRLRLAASSLSMSPAAYAPGLPESERVLLTDLSHYNSHVNNQVVHSVINLAKMRQAGAVGFYQKATDGASNWVDPTYDWNTGRAEEIDFSFGLYHFLRNISGVVQANVFLSKTKPRRGAFPHVVDVEIPMTGSVIRNYVTAIYGGLGYFPDIYTSHYCWSLITGAADKAWIAERCRLWAAHWGVFNPLIPPDWKTYVGHQFSANNNRRGAEFGCTGDEKDIDLSWFRRSWFEQYVPPAPPGPTLEERVAALEGRVSILESAA